MNDLAIRVKTLHKKFWYFKKDYKVIYWLFNKKMYDKEFYVLKGIDFDIKKGEKVGILGKNGAGKSTLLKIISEVYYPTYGEVEVNGKISSLLELGSGFNGQLTGRENIYLKGTLLGMTTEEIDAIIDEIIEFADIGEYMEMPFNSFSSGMRARLGFAMAINTDPDILIIDEVFAVGDKDFQIKSRAKTEELFVDNKTILFVSHSDGLIRQFCDRVIYLKDGYIEFDGEVEEGLAIYNKDISKEAYVPRFFTKDYRYIDDQVEVDISYGRGLGRDILNPLNFVNYEVVAEKFDPNLTNYFVHEKISVVVKNVTDSSFTISIPSDQINNRINFRIKLYDSKWDYYHYVHCVDGKLRDVDYDTLGDFICKGKERDVFTIEKQEVL